MIVHLLRHGDAVHAQDHPGDDDSRPLTGKGHRQAAALAERLAADRPAAVMSSPAQRCRETITPLADAVSVPVEQVPWLAEGSDPAAGLDAIVAAATDVGDGPLVCCSHGDVIPELLRLLALRGISFLAPPSRCEKASDWVLDLTDATTGTADYVGPPS